MPEVAVLMVSGNNEMTVACVGVASNMGVAVRVFCPTRGGVGVKVEVGGICVDVDTGEEVGTGVKVGAAVAGIKEQEENNMVKIKRKYIFFIRGPYPLTNIENPIGTTILKVMKTGSTH